VEFYEEGAQRGISFGGLEDRIQDPYHSLAGTQYHVNSVNMLERGVIPLSNIKKYSFVHDNWLFSRPEDSFANG